MTDNDFANSIPRSTKPGYINLFVVIAAFVLFFISIVLMVKSMNSLSYSYVNYAIKATSNPFIGLFIGLLATALLQSSSTTTTIVVATVASGNLSLAGAIPIVLGANIGTTITSTIISMSYITKHKEFRKAVAAGTAHDFFNILTVLILFPLEMKYHFLEQVSVYITSFVNIGSETNQQITKDIGDDFPSIFSLGAEWILDTIGAIATLLLGMTLLFICIKFISKWLYEILIGKTKDRFEKVVFRNKYRAFGWGLVITSVAQSSSLTTSLIVPLVATGKVKIQKAFQFIMGANIGTTITALLAAIFQSEAAISIAFVHLLFNLIGVLLFLVTPYLSGFPLFLAKKMGAITVKARVVAFVYVLTAFFLIPFTLIYFSQGKLKEKPADSIEVVSEG